MKKLLIFDFDGVIEDTFELSFELFKEQFKKLTHDEYRSYFDGNFYEVVKEKKLPVNIAEYYLKYSSAMKDNVINPEIKSVLSDLHDTFSFSIVSSSPENVINEYLERNGIDSFFDHVWGALKNTSKVEKLEELLKEYSIEKDDCWFITDTLGDIYEAAEVGIRSVAVTWGYHPLERLKKGNPAVIVDTPKELLDFLI